MFPVFSASASCLMNGLGFCFARGEESDARFSNDILKTKSL